MVLCMAFGVFHLTFERYNGLLGAFPNNNRSIEVQLVNRFLSDRLFMDNKAPDKFVDEFSSLIPFSGKVVGTLSVF